MSTASNPLKMIMESIERELLDTIGSEDMDIEEDDVPPPPPPATQQPPHLSPSTTPLRPPPTSTATNTKVSTITLTFKKWVRYWETGFLL